MTCNHGRRLESNQRRYMACAITARLGGWYLIFSQPQKPLAPVLLL